MPHVYYHCGGVGELETNEPAEIPITIHNHTMLNYAVAMKRWEGESDQSWEHRGKKLKELTEKIYKLASRDKDCPWYEHDPSYTHPEPDG